MPGFSVSAEYLEALSFIPTPDRYKAHAWLDDQWRGYPRGAARFWRYGIFPIGDQSLAVVRALPAAVNKGKSSIPWQHRTVPATLRGGLLYTPNKIFRWLAMRDDASAEQHIRKQLARFGNVLYLAVAHPIAVHIQRKPRSFSVPARFVEFGLQAAPDSQDTLASLLLEGIGGLRAFGLGFVVEDGLVLDMVRTATTGNLAVNRLIRDD